MNASQSRSDQYPVPSILLVEDEAIIRNATAEALREYGFEVVDADSGDMAIELLDSNPDIELVFTDVQMPGAVNGLRLAAWVGKYRPGLPCIITSGFADAERQLNELLKWAIFLAKPYDYEELVWNIRNLLAQNKDSGKQKPS